MLVELIVKVLNIPVIPANLRNVFPIYSVVRILITDFIVVEKRYDVSVLAFGHFDYLTLGRQQVC